MIVTTLLVSAVAVLLALFAKLPQGGGAIVNNHLMVMSYFLSNLPYLPPPPPPKDIISELDADIFGPRKVFLHHYIMTCNITEDQTPQSYAKSRPPGWTGSPRPKHVRLAAPTFSLPSLSPLFHKLGNIASILIALFLPWLACFHLRLLVRTQIANDSTLINTAVSRNQWQAMGLHNRLSFDLQVALSEHGKALAELEKVTMQAEEESQKAIERVFKMKQRMQKLRKERDDAFDDLALGRENFKRLGNEKEKECEKMKEETRRQIKAWEKKEKNWEQMKAREERRHEAEKDGLKMGRERERESWKGRVQRLKMEKAEEKEEMQIKVKEILKKKELGKDVWEKERGGQQEKLEVEREEQMKALEAQRFEEKDSWETWKHLAQERTMKLEEENAKWRKEAIESDRAKEEQEAARITSKGEQELERRYWEEQIIDARKLASKLMGDLLSGRKLIEDLQTDKRMDRQLLVELRAQLVRRTHKPAPTHLSPLRFGGTAYAMMLGAPNVPAAFATPKSSPQSQKVTLPSSSFAKTAQATLPPTLVSFGSGVSPELNLPIVRLPPANMYSQRPIFPISPPPPPPPPRQLVHFRLSKSSAPPPNAPMGPKGWTPDGRKAA